MLNKKTLQTLRDNNIPSNLIDVFVADEEERHIYEQTLHKDFYHQIVVGVKGIAKQRQFIQQFYPLHQKVVSLDDDIRGIETLKPEISLISLITTMFELCEKERINMWGVYPASSRLYLKDEICKGVFYIVACFYGYINKKDMIYPDLDCKEDWWATLTRCEKDGAVLRCHWIAPKTTYWLKEGGLSAAGRTIDKEYEHAKAVCELFPQYCSQPYIRRNGHPDVKLKNVSKTKVFLDS